MEKTSFSEVRIKSDNFEDIFSKFSSKIKWISVSEMFEDEINLQALESYYRADLSKINKFLLKVKGLSIESDYKVNFSKISKLEAKYHNGFIYLLKVGYTITESFRGSKIVHRVAIDNNLKDSDVVNVMYELGLKVKKNVLNDCEDMTYAELYKIRGKKIAELKEINKKIIDFDKSVKVSTESSTYYN